MAAIKPLDTTGAEVRELRSDRERPVVAVTAGDVAGIGPELVIKLLSEPSAYDVCRPLVVGAIEALERTAQLLGSTVRLLPIEESGDAQFMPGHIEVISPGGPSVAEISVGRVDSQAGEFSARCLRKSFELAADGSVNGVVWAPINKQAFQLAGYDYPDELAFLAELTGSAEPALFGAFDGLWTACVTLHISLQEVPPAITQARVLQTIRSLERALRQAGVAAPAIAVAGLNPHAGEGGKLGHEELDEIAPAVEQACVAGIDAHGPFAADTVFPRAIAERMHGVVCMYHDQANIARKLQGPRDGATIVLGLPVPCATTAHGTAFDRVGAGTASAGSLQAAVRYVAALASG
jgi:4-hydroxythreonine-4-phosphate dehydrogenase